MFPVWPHSKSKDREEVKAIAVSQVTSSVKKWAVRIGREASNYSAISFRRGSVSLAAAAKVDRNIRKRHCRWKGETTQDIYTEVSAQEAKVYGLALRKTILKSKSAKGKKVKFFLIFRHDCGVALQATSRGTGGLMAWLGRVLPTMCSL